MGSALMVAEAVVFGVVGWFPARIVAGIWGTRRRLHGGGDYFSALIFFFPRFFFSFCWGLSVVFLFAGDLRNGYVLSNI